MEADSVEEEAKFLLKDAEGFKVGDELNCFTTSVRIINSLGGIVWLKIREDATSLFEAASKSP